MEESESHRHYSFADVFLGRLSRRAQQYDFADAAKSTLVSSVPINDEPCIVSWPY
jgi:hypothetical protein